MLRAQTGHNLHIQGDRTAATMFTHTEQSRVKAVGRANATLHFRFPCPLYRCTGSLGTVDALLTDWPGGRRPPWSTPRARLLLQAGERPGPGCPLLLSPAELYTCQRFPLFSQTSGCQLRLLL